MRQSVIILLIFLLSNLTEASEIVTLRGIEFHPNRHQHWLQIATTSPDEMYEALMSDTKKNLARDVELLSLATSKSREATIESIVETIVPCEFEPPDFGVPIQKYVPPTTPTMPEKPGFKNISSPLTIESIPTAFTTRDTGSTLTIETSKHHTWYDVHLNYSFVKLAGWEKYSYSGYRSGVNYPDQPNFLTRSISANIQIYPKKWQFIGFRDAWSKDCPVGSKVAFFLRIDPIN
jgi:hypothetical protein